METNTVIQEKTFYFYFRPLAILGKMIGIFPVQNIWSANDDTNRLKVKSCSLAHLYCFCVFAGNIYMIKYFSGFIFSYNRSMMLFIVIYVMIARSSLCFLFCITHSKKLPKLIRLLDAFDRKKKRALIETNKHSCLRNSLIWTVFPIFVGIVTFAISYLESGQVVHHAIPPEVGETNIKVAVSFFGALSTWQLIPLLLYIYFGLRITCNFNIINKTLKKEGCLSCFFDENVKYPDDMFDTLEYFRHMHSMLTKTVHEMGKFYGNFMAIDQLCIIIMVIVNVCTFLSERQHEKHLLALTFFNIVIVLTALLISEEIKKSVSFVCSQKGLLLSKFFRV